MVARLQRFVVAVWLVIAVGWLLAVWPISQGWAVTGAAGILLVHALVLGLEFGLLWFLSRRLDPSWRPTAPQLLAAWWGETRASLSVFGWRQPFRSASCPDWLGHAGSPVTGRGVVLVHGFMCNRGLWNRWMRTLKQQGRAYAAVNLEPVLGSIDAYVPLIDGAVSRIAAATGQAPVLVGHSMGGLAIRAWLAHTHGDARVHHIVTIGTPHHGTWLGRFSHAVNGRKMRLQSRWLAELAARESPSRYRKFTCWYSPCDNIVMPAATATLPEADNRLVPGVAHVELADHPAILAHALAKTAIL